MSEFAPVVTLADLDSLDQAEMVEQRRRSHAEWDAAIAELRRQAVRDGRARSARRCCGR